MSVEKLKVFTADIHGRNELLGAVLDQYPKNTEVYIVGDAFHPTTHGNTRCTNQLIIDRNAKVIIGNGEHILATTMYESDTLTRLKCITDVFKPMYNGGIFDDYGLEEPDKHTSNKALLNRFDALRTKMESVKHDRIFRTMVSFYEDNEIIAVHAGLSEDPWEGSGGQKEHLVKYGRTQLETKDWLTEPNQIFDPGHYYSKSKEVPKYLTKILITGHDHSNDTAYERVTDNGRRIRLGGSQRPNSPLFVYETHSGLVVPIHAND